MKCLTTSSLQLSTDNHFSYNDQFCEQTSGAIMNSPIGIPFLNVLVTKLVDTTLGHQVYRKPTHTDGYLH
ncbi:hypothetical protein ALC57_09492 [Trachymyrmex cornetzi]|uniref:Reverse transcriptase domain-containing protein n=1 Tax=Trachymyrmex cornetzi TaxID=471704 RepID=A0A151J592_9HYME|nr:hypothetical protein ALC57_09492 [Trachymyrmex cornetzi]